MGWTVERFLNEWDVLLAPVPWLLEDLESPARNLVASYAIAAFELRTQVSRCRAWRHKDTKQIDEDFMKKVIIPLVRMHPRVSCIFRDDLASDFGMSRPPISVSSGH